MMKKLSAFLLFSFTLSACIPLQSPHKEEINPTPRIKSTNDPFSWIKHEVEIDVNYNNWTENKTDSFTVKNHLTENKEEKTSDFFYLSQHSVSKLECISSNSSLFDTICFSKWWSHTKNSNLTWDSINILWYEDGFWEIYYQQKKLQLWEFQFLLDEELINARDNGDYYPEDHMFWNNNRQQKGYLGESEKRVYYITQKYGESHDNHYVLLQKELKAKDYELLKEKRIHFVTSNKEIKEYKGGIDPSMKLISEGNLALPQIYLKDNFLYLFWINAAVKIPVDWSSLVYEEENNKLYDNNHYYQAVYHTDNQHYEFNKIPR